MLQVTTQLCQILTDFKSFFNMLNDIYFLQMDGKYEVSNTRANHKGRTKSIDSTVALLLSWVLSSDASTTIKMF